MNMNEVTDKIGHVSRASNTALALGSASMDAAVQTRMRQDHIMFVADQLRSGGYSTEEGKAELQLQLDTIIGRCPSIADTGSLQIGYAEAVRVVSIEISELYELVEKMRDIDGAVATENGDGVTRS